MTTEQERVRWFRLTVGAAFITGLLIGAMGGLGASLMLFSPSPPKLF